jgi:DNA modification methylase
LNIILDHDRATLLHGDCRHILEALPENSVDAIITDPPYLLANASGTGFMGREWDSVKLEPGETVGTASERWHRTWSATALRVLKPGGHLLAFGASRTFHRMCSAIEDVGFELRDVLFWCYGQGFPKSLDVAKVVDKSDAADERRRRELAFTAWMRTTGVTVAQINEITGTNMGSHYTTEKEQPRVGTVEHVEQIQRATGIAVPDEIWELVGRRQVLSEQFAKREVVDIVEMIDARATAPGLPGGAGAPTREVAITVPYTEAAKKWEGWGTALKPAYEPIALARKPLEGTVAGNVLQWGVGGLNVDGCRVGGPDGRWPANVILSHHPDCVFVGEREDQHTVRVGEKLGDDSRLAGTYGMGRQATTTTTTAVEVYECHADCPLRIMDKQAGVRKGLGFMGGASGDGGPAVQGSTGGASRFFYCAKPGKKEKEAGLDHLPMKSGSEITGREEGSAGIQNPRAGAGAKGGARNTHVTVKPVALMRYLCKLVTPPGGTVLDVFAGSGTTGVAALAEGFNFIGVELGGDDGSHLPILIGRVRHALGLPPDDGEPTAPPAR